MFAFVAPLNTLLAQPGREITVLRGSPATCAIRTDLTCHCIACSSSTRQCVTVQWKMGADHDASITALLGDLADPKPCGTVLLPSLSVLTGGQQ